MNRDWWDRTVADNPAVDGFFYFLDHHPMMFMLEGVDERGEPQIVYPYFHQGASLNREGTVDYAAPESGIAGQTTEYLWSISEVFQGFERNGLSIREMREYPFCGYAYLPDMTKADDGYFHRPEGALDVPLLLAFKAGW
jgi:hypothetical protein